MIVVVALSAVLRLPGKRILPWPQGKQHRLKVPRQASGETKTAAVVEFPVFCRCVCDESYGRGIISVRQGLDWKVGGVHTSRTQSVGVVAWVGIQ